MEHLAHEGIENIHGYHKHIYSTESCQTIVSDHSSSRPCEPFHGLRKSDWVLRQAHGDAKLKKFARKDKQR